MMSGQLLTAAIYMHKTKFNIIDWVIIMYIVWGYSLVMKLMNSETHSCIHSLASLETWI